MDRTPIETYTTTFLTEGLNHKDDFTMDERVTSQGIFKTDFVHSAKGLHSDDSSKVTPVAPPESAENVSGYFVPPKAKSISQLLSFCTTETLMAHPHGIHSASTDENLVCLSTDDTVKDALQSIRDHEIQATPIYNKDRKFVGVLDTKDILEYFCYVQNQNNLEKLFFNKQISDLAEVSRTDKTPTLPIGASLADVLSLLSEGTHRVAVLDDNDCVFNIISQMSMIKFIAKNITLIPQQVLQTQVQNIWRQMLEVFTMPSDTSTREAFQYLFSKDVSGAAVVDIVTGQVIDSFSSTDLVGLLYDNCFDFIDAPVIDYLAHTRRTKAVKPPICCHMDDSLELIIHKFASTKVHRLWIVDNSSMLYLGFINLTDVLRFVDRFCK